MDRLLMIDDDRELCEMISEYLAPEGFKVEAVYDGDKGLERALNGDYALVLLDVMLPKLGGFDLLRKLRATSNTRVLLLTARGVLGREFSPFDRSIDMHISKLRRKLGDLPGGQERIRTVRSAGYLYAAEPARKTVGRK